jgi:hypothetical protein
MQALSRMPPPGLRSRVAAEQPWRRYGRLASRCSVLPLLWFDRRRQLLRSVTVAFRLTLTCSLERLRSHKPQRRIGCMEDHAGEVLSSPSTLRRVLSCAGQALALATHERAIAKGGRRTADQWLLFTDERWILLSAWHLDNSSSRAFVRPGTVHHASRPPTATSRAFASAP